MGFGLIDRRRLNELLHLTMHRSLDLLPAIRMRGKVRIDSVIDMLNKHGIFGAKVGTFVPDDLMTTSDAAVEFGVRHVSFLKFIRRNRVPHFHLSQGVNLIKPSDLEIIFSKKNKRNNKK